MRKMILLMLVTIVMLQWVSADYTVDYNYKGNIVKILVPSNIHEVEYCVMSRTCEVNTYMERLVYLNVLLIKKGLNPIWK